MRSIEAGILGGTGMVGQHFIKFLEGHPWFRLSWLGASDRSAGKRYRDAATWHLGGDTPPGVANQTVQESKPGSAPKLLFSAMDASVATEIERAFAEAGVTPADIRYVSIYDSFTITVLMTLEDLGFCEKGRGGRFVAEGNLISGVGKLPFNTDGGGLCSNHPVNRGGMTKILEAVRQLRGEAHPKVQVPNCDLAIAHGTGGLPDMLKEGSVDLPTATKRVTFKRWLPYWAPR